MTITVTGASGFIGSRLMPACTAEAFDVQTLRLRGGDSVRDLPPGDVMVHLAAIAHSGHPDEDEVFRVNRDLAVATAEKVRDAGYRQFIFMSSALVWGSDYDMADRKTPERPDSAYGRAKLQAEERLRAIESSEFAVTILRPPLIYGPHVKGNLVRLMRAVHRWPVCPLGVSDNRRSILHVDNLVALILHLARQKVSGTYYPADEHPCSTLDILTHIADCMPAHGAVVEMPRIPRKLIARFAPGTAGRLFGSFVVHDDEIGNKGFVPPFNREDGFRRMVQTYLSQGRNSHEHRR